MNRLVINTANDELFIVLQKDNEIFSKAINSKMHHNETMLPVIDDILREQCLNINQINEFGVVIGPGSFTGIRVGIATVKAFRDVVGCSAKGINNLDYLYALAKSQNESIETVAINGSKDSYFVAKHIHGIVYKYERNLTLSELLEVADGKQIAMFKNDENLNTFVVEPSAQVLLGCVDKSDDISLVPVYYQLSQAENEKLKRSNLTIEIATASDLNDIYEIEKNNITVNTMGVDMVASVLNNTDYLVLKAVIDNKTVGFVMVQKSDEFNIDSIAVNKAFRNLGIATRLVEKVEEYAKQQGVGTISLEVSYNNITAYLLYKKLGFVERRVRKKYYQDNSDCIEMIKTVC